MIVKCAAVCVSVLVVACPLAAGAQSASKVLERYVEAIGGKTAVEKILSTEMSGTVRTADGRSGVFIQRTARPHVYYVSLSWGDVRWRAGFNGRSAWQDDTVAGTRTLYGQAASRVRAEARDANTRFLMPDKVSRVTVTGRDTVRGRPVIVIVAITPDGLTQKLSFDSDTYLLVKDEQQTDEGVEERFFDDYRPVDQVKEPHQIEWHRTGEVFRIAVDRVVHNSPLEAQVFDVPGIPTGPSLDVEGVLSAAERTEQRAERVRTSYAYTQSLSLRIMDQQGQVDHRQGSAFEIFHLGGYAVGRQIRRLDGQPLSEAERRREDKRVTDLVGEYERRGAAGVAARRGREDLDASAYALRGLGGSLVLRVPVMTSGWFPAYRRVSHVSNLRRESNGSRTAIVMDFQPKSGVVPNGDVERQASRMAGTLWIDDASQQVIRIESHFIDDYDSIVQGSAVSMEQTRVNDEVWLPSRIETNVRRSLNFGAMAQPLVMVQFTDYKKFGVETDSAIALPDAR